ncbi:hypothetical protein JRQ81_011738 [Phrynocephalus forsythii]|uniref:Uncharacterized protein n=1 Tax=Phrynocephalus forsythii TaxID=171643 RepID=A0A9Q0X6F5_9SAUR|nr:hypothetical protein JRQ81_011738 [Phrynocephalus forsythii]
MGGRGGLSLLLRSFQSEGGNRVSMLPSRRVPRERRRPLGAARAQQKAKAKEEDEGTNEQQQQQQQQLATARDGVIGHVKVDRSNPSRS